MQFEYKPPHHSYGFIRGGESTEKDPQLVKQVQFMI